MSKEKLKSAEEFRQEHFTGKKPDITTIRRWIKNGHLPGKTIGRRYYVDMNLYGKTTGNPLVDKVIME